MKRINKFIYLWVIQGRYPGPYGWEDVDQSESYKEARTNYKLYRTEEPQYPHRLIRRREPNPDYQEAQ